MTEHYHKTHHFHLTTRMNFIPFHHLHTLICSPSKWVYHRYLVRTSCSYSSGHLMVVIWTYNCFYVRAFNTIHNPVLFLSCFRITAIMYFSYGASQMPSTNITHTYYFWFLILHTHYRNIIYSIGNQVWQSPYQPLLETILCLWWTLMPTKQLHKGKGCSLSGIISHFLLSD